MAAAVAAIVLLLWEKSRDKIIEFFMDVLDKLRSVLKTLVEWFRSAVEIAMNIAEASSPYALISLAVAAKFYQNVTEMTDELIIVRVAKLRAHQ